MITIMDQAHYDRVVAFAVATNQMSKFQKVLDYLNTYSAASNPDGTRRTDGSNVKLWRDFAPASFALLVEKRRETGTGEWYTLFNGGLIYHGNTAGWGEGEDCPPFSVRIDDLNTNPWSVHT